mmetsp:Transcript_74918/g.231432  ORF Transcript_74918/g.231432 Transcript_74918/m.231432 type:complete len:200 (-) Transcript_74918:64-663(-)
MNMPSVRSPGPFLYSTLSSIFKPAPPHRALSASCFVTSSAFTSKDVNLVTALSLGSVPAVCMAWVSHSGPMSRSICGVKGKRMPQYSPGSVSFTTALNSFIFLGLPPSPNFGKTAQTSSGIGAQRGLPAALAAASNSSALASASAFAAWAFASSSAAAAAAASASACSRCSSASSRCGWPRVRIGAPHLRPLARRAGHP